jgi:transaldolase
VSRWDVAVASKVPADLRNRLGNAIALRTHVAARTLHGSARWLRAQNAGARPQRVLWASTGTKDPSAPDSLYVKALAAPYTVNTVPEATLLAFADHGEVGAPIPDDGGDAEEVIARHARAGVDVDALAAQLQADGARAFVKSWNDLLEGLAGKTGTAGQAP